MVFTANQHKGVPPAPSTPNSVKEKDVRVGVGESEMGPRIGVLGGGLAGAETTRILAESGAHPILLEARDRLGGRIRSERHEGVLVERGATFVNPWDDYLLALCKKVGVELIDDGTARPSNRYGFELAGKMHGSESLREGAALLDAAFAHDRALVEAEIGRPGRPNAHAAAGPVCQRLDQMSAQQYLDSVPGLPAHIKAALSLHVVSDLGRNLDELSALTFIYYEVDPDQTYLRVKDGTSQIIERTLSGLDSRIHLDSPVEMIRHTPAGRVEVKFAGQEHSGIFDAVVIAMPFSTLRDVDLAGLNLDERARRAITHTNYSKHSKMAILPVQAAPLRDSATNMQLASEAAGGLVWEDNLANRDSLGALTLFTGGGRAEQLNALGREALLDRIVQVMKVTGQLVPGMEKLVPHQALLMNWTAEEYTKGGYAVDLVGDVTTTRGAVSPGQLFSGGTIGFAGEHIGYKGARNHLNAAAGSGGEAAKAILREAKKEILGAID